MRIIQDTWTLWSSFLKNCAFRHQELNTKKNPVIVLNFSCCHCLTYGLMDFLRMALRISKNKMLLFIFAYFVCTCIYVCMCVCVCTCKFVCVCLCVFTVYVYICVFVHCVWCMCVFSELQEYWCILNERSNILWFLEKLYISIMKKKHT